MCARKRETGEGGWGRPGRRRAADDRWGWQWALGVAGLLENALQEAAVTNVTRAEAGTSCKSRAAAARSRPALHQPVDYKKPRLPPPWHSATHLLFTAITRLPPLASHAPNPHTQGETDWMPNPLRLPPPPGGPGSLIVGHQHGSWAAGFALGPPPTPAAPCINASSSKAAPQPPAQPTHVSGSCQGRPQAPLHGAASKPANAPPTSPHC